MDTLAKAKNESSGKSNNKLIIHTSNGIYLGDLRDQIDCSNIKFENTDDTLTCFNKIYLNSLEKYQSSEKAKDIPEISENSITNLLNSK